MKRESEGWEKLEAFKGPDPSALEVAISVIIPTHNSAQALGTTLRSLAAQHYPHLEVIVIDASSTDQTPALVHAATELKPRLYSVPTYDVYEMFNRGLSLVSGGYFCVLLPGDHYVSAHTLANMADLIQRSDDPDLAYCGCILREPESDPRHLFRPYSLQQLKNGKQPTTIQSCWFRQEAVRHLGRFDPRYQIRGSFDLLCRMIQEENIAVASLPRYYIDHERNQVSYSFLLQRSWETFAIIFRHFGWWRALVWFIGQNPFRLLSWAWKSVRISLTRG